MLLMNGESAMMTASITAMRSSDFSASSLNLRLPVSSTPAESSSV